LALPHYIAEDRNGNLYIGDSLNNRVREVTVAGNIITVAGTGIAGYRGDGGSGRLALVSDPAGVVVDASGSVLFADYGNNRIRKIDPTGVITTISGNGIAGYSGDGGPAKLASLNGPFGIALDAIGDVYFSELGNEVIRQVDTSGIIHTVAGNGKAGFSGDGGLATLASLNFPRGVVVDSSGSLYIGDASNDRVREVDTKGIITTFAGNGSFGCTGDGGPATSASFGWANGFAISGGSLLIGTNGCSRVRAIDLATTIITTFAGSSGGFNGDGNPPLLTQFSELSGLLVDSLGELVVVDEFNERIRKVDSFSQTIVTIAGGFVGDGGPGTKASLNLPEGIGFDSTGNLYIADYFNNRVRKVSPSGTISTFAGTGISGDSGDGGQAVMATLNRPQAVAVDPSGNVFIADQNGTFVRKVDPSGNITSPSYPFYYVTSLAADSLGNLYAVDADACVVWKVTPAGAATIVAGVQNKCGYNRDGILAIFAWLNPNGVAVDAKGNIFIADYYNNRVRKVGANGVISTVAGNGTCGFSGDGGPAKSAMVCPLSVAVAKGTLYIADYDNARVRSVDVSGTIQTLAGTGSFGYNGNGLPALQTNLGSPVGVAVNPAGIPFVDDDLESRVRKIQ
jgi:streptogramin lyase